MKQLYFIYNANSGLGNALLDVGRRFAQPKDYPCALCFVTYGPFGMKKEWKEFLAGLPYESKFFHKDEVLSDITDIAPNLPAVLLVDENQEATVVMAGEMFNDIKDLETLKKLLVAQLAAK